MKRLFVVNQKPFASKEEAKIERDGLKKAGYDFPILLGPDHWRYKSGIGQGSQGNARRATR